MLPAIFVLAVVASSAPAGPAPAEASKSTEGQTEINRAKAAPGTLQNIMESRSGCISKDASDIVVCGERGQGYRLDPSVMDASQTSESNSRSATSKMPVAQAACAASPMGCGKGLEGLDLANVALVMGSTAIRAAKGEDWTKALRTGGSDEYQLYLQAKQRREDQAAERAGEVVKKKAQKAEQEERTGTSK